MRRPGVPMGVGVGAFAGRIEPQAADLTMAGELLASTLGPGGLHVSDTTASNRRFTGADLSPQLYLVPPAYPNDGASLAQSAALGVGNTRRAQNRGRGGA